MFEKGRADTAVLIINRFPFKRTVLLKSWFKRIIYKLQETLHNTLLWCKEIIGLWRAVYAPGDD
jgi:hypothetical protein